MSTYIHVDVPDPTSGVDTDFANQLHHMAIRHTDTSDRQIEQHMNDDISFEMNAMDQMVYNEKKNMIRGADRLMSNSIVTSSIYDIPEHLKSNAHQQQVYDDIDTAQTLSDMQLVQPAINKVNSKSSIMNNIVLFAIVIIIIFLVYRQYDKTNMCLIPKLF
jgi:predicted RND superfamily exporter protein